MSYDREQYRMPSFEEGQADQDRLVTFVNEKCWEDHRAARRAWERTVEENVRMLSGRQYDVFLETRGEFVDMRTFFASSDEMSRLYPVYNWLAHYFRLGISKVTENMPQIGGMPKKPDMNAVKMAELWDSIWKYQWNQMELPELYATLMGWVLTAGRGILKLRWDVDRGPAEDFRAALQPGQLVDAYGAPVNPDAVGEVPFRLDEESQQFVPDVTFDDQNEMQMGQPYRHRLGDLCADVLNPLAVLTPVSPAPFHRKPWYTYEYLMTCEDVWNRYQIEVEPDTLTADDDLLLRIDYATHYGMPGTLGQNGSLPDPASLRDMVRVREHWRRDVPNDPDLHYGRVSVVTKSALLHDERNPYIEEGVQEQTIIPIYAFDLPAYPFRQEGTTDIESLTPLCRSLNRRMGAMQDAVERNEQPIKMIERDSGIDEGADLNMPGAEVEFDGAAIGGRDPIRYLNPPGVPAGSAEFADQLLSWVMRLGYVNAGAEGGAVTDDASGELQRQVRWDNDRPWGLVLRHQSYVWARLAGDMVDILSVTYTDERIISVVGKSRAVKFLSVKPEMFQGKLHFSPMPESQVLETRQEKQNRIKELVGLGMPIEIGLQALNYPDLDRVMQPGGPAYDRVMQEHLEVYLGQYPEVLPEHDHAFDILLHKQEQQTLEYRNAGPVIQGLMNAHIQAHQLFAAQVAVQDTELAADVAEATTGATSGAMDRASRPAKSPKGSAGADPASAPSGGSALSLAG